MVTKTKKSELYLPFMKSKAVANQECNAEDLKCKKNGITRWQWEYYEAPKIPF